MNLIDLLKLSTYKNSSSIHFELALEAKNLIWHFSIIVEVGMDSTSTTDVSLIPKLH